MQIYDLQPTFDVSGVLSIMERGPCTLLCHILELSAKVFKVVMLCCKTFNVCEKVGVTDVTATGFALRNLELTHHMCLGQHHTAPAAKVVIFK